MTNGGIFGPIEEIMKMLEDTFSNVKKTNQAGAEK
jgi:hypothetical protein